MISEEEVCQGRGLLETRCDVLIQGLWEHPTEAIVNVKFGDADTDTYKHDPMDKLLDCWDNQKKDNHGKQYHEQRKYFLVFFYLLMTCLERSPWLYSQI